MELHLNISELNAVIYDYLLRTGMQHAAFAFKAECVDNFSEKTVNMPNLESTYMQGVLFQKLKDDEELDIDMPNGSSETNLKQYIDEMIKKTLGVDISAIPHIDKSILEKEESTVVHANGNGPAHGIANISYRFETIGRFIYGIEREFRELFVIDVECPHNNKICKVSQPIQERKPKISFGRQIYVYSSDFFMILEAGSMQLKAAYDVPSDINIINLYEVYEDLIIIESDDKTLLLRDLKLEACLDRMALLGNTYTKVYFSNKAEKKMYRYDLNEKTFEEITVMRNTDLVSFKAIPELGIAIFILNETQNLKSNMIGILRDNDDDFIITAEVKSKFKRMVIYKDIEILLIAEDVIKCVKLANFDIVFTFKANEPIKNANFVTDTRILIEYIGNRFKLFDSITKLTTDMEKTDSAAYMLYNTDLKTLIEIKNFETFNLISI